MVKQCNYPPAISVVIPKRDDCSISVAVRQPCGMSAILDKATVGIGVSDIYEGEYEVSPKPFDETVLETKAKVMKDNVRVSKIPYFETGNEFGNTVYIGNEVDIIG